MIEQDSCHFVFVGSVEEDIVVDWDGDDLVDLVVDDSVDYEDVNKK